MNLFLTWNAITCYILKKKKRNNEKRITPTSMTLKSKICWSRPQSSQMLGKALHFYGFFHQPTSVFRSDLRDVTQINLLDSHFFLTKPGDPIFLGLGHHNKYFHNLSSTIHILYSVNFQYILIYVFSTEGKNFSNPSMSFFLLSHLGFAYCWQIDTLQLDETQKSYTKFYKALHLFQFPLFHLFTNETRQSHIAFLSVPESLNFPKRMFPYKNQLLIFVSN